MNPQEWIEKVAEYEDAAAQTRGVFLGQTVRFAREGAQHLAAALAEISRLRSEVDALRAGVAVVVPELTEEDMKQVTGREFFNGFRTGYNLAADRIHSVPASRVLKDGEVGIGPRQSFDSAPKDGSLFLAWHSVWKCPIAIMYKPGFSNLSQCVWIEGTRSQAWPSEAFDWWAPLDALRSQEGGAR